MRGNLPARDFERNGLLSALHRNLDLGAGPALHPAHHAVLGESDSRDAGRVYLDEPVAGLESYLLGRASGNHLYHYGSVVGHVELYAYPVEVAGEIFLMLRPFPGYHIYGVRVEDAQGRLGHGVGDLLPVDRVHIVLVYASEDEVHLSPVFHACAHDTRLVCHRLQGEDAERTYGDAQQGYHI